MRLLNWLRGRKWGQHPEYRKGSSMKVFADSEDKMRFADALIDEIGRGTISSNEFDRRVRERFPETRERDDFAEAVFRRLKETATRKLKEAENGLAQSEEMVHELEEEARQLDRILKNEGLPKPLQEDYEQRLDELRTRIDRIKQTNQRTRDSVLKSKSIREWAIRTGMIDEW